MWNLNHGDRSGASFITSKAWLSPRFLKKKIGLNVNVLSLFDGMACGRIALERAGIPVTSYYASEVDKYAIKVAKANYPDIQHIGDVRNVSRWSLDFLQQAHEIDLLIAGSPCQGFSFAGKQLNFSDPRSKLFFEFVRLLKECKPRYFFLENVVMKQEYQDVITSYLGVKPIKINSALVSAQNRKRLYWTNIPGINQPVDRGIVLSDVLDLTIQDCPIGVKVREKSKCIRTGGRNSPFNSRHEWDSPFQRVSKKGKVKPNISKSACLTGGGNSGGNHSDMDIIHTPFATRRYTPVECERLQTVDDNYTNHVSNSQRYKMLGNGWTVDVIAHCFSYIKNQILKRGEFMT